MSTAPSHNPAFVAARMPALATNRWHRPLLRRLIKTIGFERGIDTLVWQLIASVATPGYTIHTVVAAANWALARAEESSQVRRQSSCSALRNVVCCM